MPDPDHPADADTPATRASAHLPGLDIEIVHRRSPAGDADHFAINLQAVPAFSAFDRYIEAANPFAFWIQVTQLVWAPWLAVASAMIAPANLPRPLRRVSGRTHPIVPEQEPS